jgi:hypothetical protein
VPGLFGWDGRPVVALDATTGPLASAAFLDAVVEGRVCHRGQGQLTAAVEAARQRRIGDRWVWERRWGVDTSPLLAATWAHWVAAAGPKDGMYVW